MMTPNSTHKSQPFTAPHVFTEGVEGSACDADGNLYAVNFARQGTIGKITSDGNGEVFVELPNGSVGNGIRFNVYCSDPNWRDETGNLWRVGLDGKATLLESNMGTTNGIEVSSDEHTLYVNESVQHNIWAYDLSPDSEVSNKQLLIHFDDEHIMDGMRCDVAGNLYVTRYGKGTVAKVSPQGEVLYEIQLGGASCTNVCFGGPDGRTLYITIVDSGSVEQFRAELPGREWQLFSGSSVPITGSAHPLNPGDAPDIAEAIERNLLTTLKVATFMHALKQPGQRIETPYLHIAYQPPTC